MMTNMKVLPLPVVAAIVAHFDSNLDTRTFSQNDANIHINEAHMDDGGWIVSATHVSGIDVDIIVTDDLRVEVWADFGEKIRVL